jgi:hypothetical protein
VFLKLPTKLLYFRPQVHFLGYALIHAAMCPVVMDGTGHSICLQTLMLNLLGGLDEE